MRSAICLEQEMHSELNQPRVHIRVANRIGNRVPDVYEPSTSKRPGAGIRELRVVERIVEVGAELHLETLSDLEILVYAEVHIGVMRPAKATELDSASAKGSDGWVGEVAIVGEPLEAAGSSGDWGFSGNSRETIAIGTRAARERAGIVRCS